MTILLAFKRNKNNVENEKKKISKKTELTQGKREACPGRQGGSAVGVNKQVQRGNLSYRDTVRI